MGRFGIQFSDENNQAFKITKRKTYSTVVNLDNNDVEETRMDRVMAWLSYYVMVFVAVCVFNQPAAAFAYDSVTRNVMQLVDQNVHSDFELRGTR
ncbi:MAG: hypothetical protein WBC71_05310 [Salaquimonas sp.]